MNTREWRALHAQVLAMRPVGGGEKVERAFYVAAGDLERAVRKAYGGGGMDSLLKSMPADEEVKPEVENALAEFREKVMRLKYLG